MKQHGAVTRSGRERPTNRVRFRVKVSFMVRVGVLEPRGGW